MYGNGLPADQLNALQPGDAVIVESFASTWSHSEIRTGTVAKLTPKQIVVHYPAYHGTIEARFRRDDGRRLGSTRGALLDPAHPDTVNALAKHQRKRREQTIDSLAGRWARERDNLDLLRHLQVAIGEYLVAESAR